MPSAEEKRIFVVEYLSAKSDATDRDKFIGECEAFEPLSHLHWALWGLLKEVRNGEFDYFGYALERLRRINSE